MKKLLLTLLGILSVLPILAQDFTFISENGVILTFSITNATAKTCAVKAPATTDVTTITLPSKAAYNGVSYTVTSIGDYAFQNCDKLTNIEIPGTISSIGRNAFDGCLILKKIDIPSSVTNINTYSFHNCKSLTSVTIPNKITTIGTWAFAGCSALETVILSPSVTTIAYSAFKECKSLKTVYIGPNVKSIGQDAFGNDPIQDVYITAQTIPTTGTGVFNKITDTATLHVQGDEQVVNLYKRAEHWSSFPNIVPITVPQSVAAFKTVSYDRYALSAGMNSSSTYSLGMNLNEPISFNSCMVNANYQPLAGDINSSFWRSSNPAVAYVDADGMITLLEKPNKSNPPVITLESLYAGSPKIEFTIYANDFSAEADGMTLHYIVLDEDKKTAAVTGASQSSKTVLSLPASVTSGGKQYSLAAISDIAFFESSLTQVTMPAPIVAIGKAAFKGSQALEAITLPYSLSSFGADAFYGCRALKAIQIPCGIKSLPENTFHDCKALTDVKLDDFLTSVGSWAFAGCSNLTNIILPPSVTSVGASSFNECTKLNTVYMGPNIKNVYSNAFGKAPIQDLYITAQSLPSIGTGITVFNNLSKTATLHVQGDEQVVNLYKGAEHWSSFPNIVPITAPQSVAAFKTVSYDRYALSAGINSSSTYSLGMNLNEPISFNSCMVNATYQPLAGDINSSFWRSSNPAVAYVDADGMITLLEKPNKSNPPVITLESLYAGSPKIEFTIYANDFSAEADGMTLNYTVLDEAEKTVAVTGTSTASKNALAVPASVSFGGSQYSVTAISEIAFFESAISRITLPAPITSIGKAAFKGDKTLETVDLPNSLSSLGAEAFYGCIALKEVELPNLIENIDRSTFHDCKAITTIKLPTSLKTVGSFAFAGSGLQTVVFSPGINTIGYSAFKECKSLQTAYIGPNLRTIDKDAFGNCPLLTNVYLTAPNPPALGSGALNQFSGKLWLQGGEATRLLYEHNEAWQALASSPRVDYVEVPTEVTVSKAVEKNAPAKIESEYNSTSHIYATPGDETQRIASTVPADVTIPYTFWSSSDPSAVYVSSDGQIIVHQYPQIGTPVTLTAKTLYDNGPSHLVTVDNFLMTGIDEIATMEPELERAAEANTMIFTTNGMYVGTSLNGLLPGVYIVKQNRKIVKINIR